VLAKRVISPENQQVFSRGRLELTIPNQSLTTDFQLFTLLFELILAPIPEKNCSFPKNHLLLNNQKLKPYCEFSPLKLNAL
jgi:hypothetical protein